MSLNSDMFPTATDLVWKALADPFRRQILEAID